MSKACTLGNISRTVTENPDETVAVLEDHGVVAFQQGERVTVGCLSRLHGPNGELGDFTVIDRAGGWSWGDGEPVTLVHSRHMCERGREAARSQLTASTSAATVTDNDVNNTTHDILDTYGHNVIVRNRLTSCSSVVPGAGTYVPIAAVSGSGSTAVGLVNTNIAGNPNAGLC